MMLEPFPGPGRCVLEVVVLLEDKVVLHPEVMNRVKEVLVKDSGILLCIHNPINNAHTTYTFCCHAAPYHH
jgi:predicted nucleic-acid-binding protein